MAWFEHAKYGPGIKLEGQVEPGQEYAAGSHVVFLPGEPNTNEATLLGLGVAVKAVREGRVSYSLRGTPRLRLTKSGRLCVIDRLDTVTAAPPPAPAPHTPSVPAPTSHPTNLQESVQQWEALGEEYGTAAFLVIRALTRTLGCKKDDLVQEAVQAGIATLIIGARQRNVMVSPGLWRAVWERMNPKQAAAARLAQEAVQAAQAKTVAQTPRPAPSQAPALVAAGPGLESVPPALQTPEDDELPF
jgi:hypothetical protein